MTIQFTPSATGWRRERTRVGVIAVFFRKELREIQLGLFDGFRFGRHLGRCVGKHWSEHLVLFALFEQEPHDRNRALVVFVNK